MNKLNSLKQIANSNRKISVTVNKPEGAELKPEDS